MISYSRSARLAGCFCLTLAFGLLCGQQPLSGQGKEPIVPPKKGPDDPTKKGGPQTPGGTGAYDEVEDPAAKKIRDRVTIDDEAPAIAVPKGAFYFRIEDLARATADARQLPVRTLYAKYVVAFDQLTDFQDQKVRITPIPAYRLGKIPAIYGVFDLDERNQPQPLRRVDSTKTRAIQHYEEMIHDEVAKLTDSRQVEPKGVDFPTRIEMSENLLRAALFFHDAARDQSKRRGVGWEQVRSKTVDLLTDVRLRRLKLAAERKDWPLLRTLGSRMVSLYPNNLKLLEEVFTIRLAEALLAATESEQPAELESARDLIVEFDSRFPGSKNATAEQVREALKAKAKRFYELAKSAIQANDQKKGQQLLRTVEMLDPNFGGLRELQGQLVGAYSILYVGTRQLPERLTPLTARFPSEQQASSLIFEPLLEALPDETFGVRYRPVLATMMPTPSGLAREVSLQKSAEWSGLDREYLDASDVAGTLKGLNEKFPHTWLGQHAHWLSDRTRVLDRSTLRLQLQSGHPYPLSLLTTKILPAKWLLAQNKQLDDFNFALKPSGSGPFKLLGPQQPNNGPPEVAFVANGAFARRPGRLGQPYIKEVRFVDVSRVADKPALFRSGQLHLLPDVPTAELANFTAPAAKLTGLAQVVTTTTNRQIYLLAINHHRPHLNNVALRRALAHAIDRDDVLDKAYRAGFKQFHKPLVGPYPPESWAIPKLAGAIPPELFNANLAQSKFGEYALTGGGIGFSILYPLDDPRARVACERMQKQFETAAGTVIKVNIRIEGVNRVEFHERVYNTGDYDMAYVAYEYPDDWYPYALSLLLQPEAQAAGGRNFLRYPPKTATPNAEDKQLGQQLEEIRRTADFSGKLAPYTHELQRRFVEAMPFIPLWQLDRHLVISSKLQLHFDETSEPSQPKLLLPDHLLTGIARWRLLE